MAGFLMDIVMIDYLMVVSFQQPQHITELFSSAIKLLSYFVSSEQMLLCYIAILKW